MKLSHKHTAQIVALVVGLAVGVIAGLTLSWRYAPLLGWDAAAVILLIHWLRVFVNAKTPEQTAEHATSDDAQRGVSDGIVLLAGVASLGAVAFLLTSKGGNPLVSVSLGLASIVLSWAVVHCSYTLHYAALYYGAGGKGIDFGDDVPTFGDFAYLAFTIGMTYQVSDTGLQSRQMRQTLLRHALLSFLFGTAIIATSINVVASLSG